MRYIAKDINCKKLFSTKKIDIYNLVKQSDKSVFLLLRSSRMSLLIS